MKGFTFRDEIGLFELFMDYSFNPLTDTVTSPRTGEACQAIPQPFRAKVKEGGYAPQKIRPVSQNTIGSLADKNSSNSAWLSEQIEKDREQRYKDKIKSIEVLEEKLGQSLPRPVLNPERPFWRNTDTVDTSLTKMTKEETQKYIIEGKKPLSLDKRGKKEKNKDD